MQYDILKKIRKQKKITQAEMAKRLSVTRDLMNKYENGKSSPRVPFLESWCGELGMEVRILIRL